MKKAIGWVLAVVVMLSISPAVFAAEKMPNTKVELAAYIEKATLSQAKSYLLDSYRWQLNW